MDKKQGTDMVVMSIFFKSYYDSFCVDILNQQNQIISQWDEKSRQWVRHHGQLKN